MFWIEDFKCQNYFADFPAKTKRFKIVCKCFHGFHTWVSCLVKLLGKAGCWLKLLGKAGCWVKLVGEAVGTYSAHRRLQRTLRRTCSRTVQVLLPVHCSVRQECVRGRQLLRARRPCVAPAAFIWRQRRGQRACPVGSHLAPAGFAMWISAEFDIS